MEWNYKFITRLPENFTDEDILFIKQLGIDYTYVSLPRDKHNLKDLKILKERIESGGLKITSIQSNLYTYNTDIALGTCNRDVAIDGYIEFIEMLSEVGIKFIEQNMNPFFIYSSNMTTTTRGAITRLTDVNTIINSKTVPLGKPAWINPDHENIETLIRKYFDEASKRAYTREELWDNFAYFMQRVMPIVEKHGLRVLLHPNDPPLEESICGIPQLIRNFSDYQKAFEIANSEGLGMTFCCGCWLEGGEKFGNLIDNMEWALEHKKIETVHIRNISDPMPKFYETFLDNGYYDIYQIFRVLRKYNYQGFINPDHHPIMVDGPIRRIPQGYAFGFMRAYAMRADAEYRIMEADQQ